MARVGRRVLRKKSKIWGGILATFSEGKLYILGFQEGIQDNDDFENVLASICARLLKASERQKLGFRIGGVYFFRMSGVLR